MLRNDQIELLPQRLLGAEAKQRGGGAVPAPDRPRAVGEDERVRDRFQNALGRIRLTVPHRLLPLLPPPTGAGSSARSAARDQHRRIDSKKCGESENPGGRRDMHERQGKSGRNAIATARCGGAADAVIGKARHERRRRPRRS